MTTWRDLDSTSWGGWVVAISFPLLLLTIWFLLPVEKMVSTLPEEVLLILTVFLLVFSIFWIKGLLVARKTIYKVSVGVDNTVSFFLHFNQTIETSIKKIIYVTPCVSLSTEELMVETSNTRNIKYLIQLSNGKEYYIRNTMDDLEILLKVLSGGMVIDEFREAKRDEEITEKQVNSLIYGVSMALGFVMVGGILALTLLPFVEASYGRESAATFTAFVWLPIVIVGGSLVGMLVGYFIVKYRSGKRKAVEGLIGK